MPIAKIAAIHDITGVGRCGLSVITPILSALCHQVCPLPTALLSAHPGGFTDFHIHSLADDAPAVLAHWEHEALRFDACYTGYMCATAQVRAVTAALTRIKHTVLLVDPVMGDHGKLYSIVDAPLVAAMRELAATATIITPNLTEAHTLLEIPYEKKMYTHMEAQDLAAVLSARYEADCIVKGVPLADGRMTNVLAARNAHNAIFAEYAQEPTSFPGTGDAFAALLLGVYLHSRNLEQAFQIATAIATELVIYTHAQKTPVREGVLVEAFCPSLARKCGIKNGLSQ